MNDERLGFFESWTPFYSYEDYVPPSEKKKKPKRSSKEEPSQEPGGSDSATPGTSTVDADTGIVSEATVDSDAEEQETAGAAGQAGAEDN